MRMYPGSEITWNHQYLGGHHPSTLYISPRVPIKIDYLGRELFKLKSYKIAAVPRLPWSCEDAHAPFQLLQRPRVRSSPNHKSFPNPTSVCSSTRLCHLLCPTHLLCTTNLRFTIIGGRRFPFDSQCLRRRQVLGANPRNQASPRSRSSHLHPPGDLQVKR